jgi:uncharacterized protein YlxW (UPF0749 family)
VSAQGIDGTEERWLGGRRPSMRPPPRVRSRLVVAAIALGVGFLVAVQAVGADRTALSRLAAERPEDLTRILADLNEEADRLSRQVSALRVRVLRYRGSARADELALRDAREALLDLQVLSGETPVEGPGVEVAIEDPQDRVGWEALLDLVQELRDAGAEALAVGDVRVIASTWVGPADGGVTIDGGRISPPYVLGAIGPSDTLAEALDIPGGPLSVLAALPGVRVSVETADRLTLPAAASRPPFRYARPAG